MKNFFSHYRIPLAFSIAVLIFSGCSKDDNNDSGTSTPTASTDREKAVNDYNTNYLGSNVTDPGWTGSTATCNAGTVPQSTNNAVIKRINYFRKMVGLNDNCTLDASLAAQEQKTVLMMTANNQLSHAPPTSWLCYSAEGAAGAASSNLSLGTVSHSTNAVTAFIDDFGTSNTAAGHRRWLLHSAKTSFSYGTTNTATAIYVFGAGGNTQIPEFIAYPPKGFVPQELVFSRWSFGIPNADFSSANVSMTGPSGAITLSKESVQNGFGDNTLVWVPQGINTSSATDITYTVNVSGILNALLSSYTYNVVLIKP